MADTAEVLGSCIAAACRAGSGGSRLRSGQLPVLACTGVLLFPAAALPCPEPRPPALSPWQVTEPGSVEPRTLYGVCCYVRELVHRPPSMAREVNARLGCSGRSDAAALCGNCEPPDAVIGHLGRGWGGRAGHPLQTTAVVVFLQAVPPLARCPAPQAFPGCNAPLTRYLVVAPRCYCLLTHHPFFALHFRVGGWVGGGGHVGGPSVGCRPRGPLMALCMSLYG